MSIERRESPRRALNMSGVIRDSTGAVVRCIVADVSATGAKLVFKTTADVPEEFTLVLSRGGAVRRSCRVVRRSETTLGVKFVLPLA